MAQNDFLLGVEEVALAMSMVGQPEMAHNLMVVQLGTMSQEEARARLLAAGHSLIARGWLTMDEHGEMHLAAPLARIARVLSRADFSIRYTRSHQNAELALTFHFGEGGIFAHRMEQGVVHHISEIQDADLVIEGGMTFFDVMEAQPFTCPLVEIPYSLLEKIKDEENPSEIGRQLEEHGVPEETRVLLAEDLQKVQYRGSIMRVEYGKDNVPRSDHGLLVLRGPKRLWLFRPIIRGKQPFVTPLPCTEQVFRQEVAALIAVS